MNKYIEGYLYIGISASRLVAWKFLDSKLCLIEYMKTQPSPMPWEEAGRN